jgi:hypothetical protein
MTPRLAQIIAAMVDAKLDSETRRVAEQRGRMPATGRADRATYHGSANNRRGGRL